MDEPELIVTEVIQYMLNCPVCMKELKTKHTDSGKWYMAQLAGASGIDCPRCNITLCFSRKWMLRFLGREEED